MKEFRENYKPEKIKLIDVEDNEHELTVRFMTSSDFNYIESLMDEKQHKELSWTERSIEVLIKACGMDREFWMRFSMQLLTEVSQYILLKKTEQNKKKAIHG